MVSALPSANGSLRASNRQRYAAGEHVGAQQDIYNELQGSIMKRLIVATSLFAIVVVPSFGAEIGPPHEELNVERALPQIAETAAAPHARNDSAPFEQLTLIQLAEAPSLSSNTRSYAEIASAEVVIASPWINDHNFIAPAL
jgi:hypothetical protein